MAYYFCDYLIKRNRKNQSQSKTLWYGKINIMKAIFYVEKKFSCFNHASRYPNLHSLLILFGLFRKVYINYFILQNVLSFYYK